MQVTHAYHRGNENDVRVILIIHLSMAMFSNLCVHGNHSNDMQPHASYRKAMARDHGDNFNAAFLYRWTIILSTRPNRGFVSCDFALFCFFTYIIAPIVFFSLRISLIAIPSPERFSSPRNTIRAMLLPRSANASMHGRLRSLAFHANLPPSVTSTVSMTTVSSLMKMVGHLYPLTGNSALALKSWQPHPIHGHDF